MRVIAQSKKQGSHPAPHSGLGNLTRCTVPPPIRLFLFCSDYIDRHFVGNVLFPILILLASCNEARAPDRPAYKEPDSKRIDALVEIYRTNANALDIAGRQRRWLAERELARIEPLVLQFEREREQRIERQQEARAVDNLLANSPEIDR